MLAYVCIGGVNVDESDARALAELIGDTPVRLDLIDVTDPTGQVATPRTGANADRFMDALSRYVRQPVVRRYSGGADIQAACGTLAGSMSPRASTRSEPPVIVCEASDRRLKPEWE